MFKIGCHLSISDGFLEMFNTISSIGANTVQFFTRNPRSAKKIKNFSDFSVFLSKIKDLDFAILGHSPYILNLCSSNEEIRILSKNLMDEDIKFMGNIKNSFYNFHPGSHTGQGIKKGIEEIASSLNTIITKDTKTTILLETMTGKGTEIGGNFFEIKEIINSVDRKDKIGVCFDTCHVFDAGYDIKDNLDKVLDDFDRIIGLERLKFIHLNDSLNSLGSKKDRHAKIGLGNIGLKSIDNIINNKFLKNLPFCLETPNDIYGYKKEIDLLKNLYKN